VRRTRRVDRLSLRTPPLELQRRCAGGQLPLQRRDPGFEDFELEQPRDAELGRRDDSGVFVAGRAWFRAFQTSFDRANRRTWVSGS
jgi:hypothetical protein